MTKQNIIDILKTLPIRNEKYIIKYVEFCLNNSSESSYDCKHHILPQSKNLFIEYSDLNQFKWNCAKLSYKNHFKAHWLLMKGIIHKSITFAFFAMKNKDIKSKKISFADIDYYAEEYDSFFKEYIKNISVINKDKVTVINKNNETIRVSKNEYRNNKDKYSTHSNGIICVTDQTTGKKLRISTDIYDKSKYSTWSSGKANYLNIITRKKEFLKTKDINRNHIHINSLIPVIRNNTITQIKYSELLDDDKILLYKDIEKCYEYTGLISYKVKSKMNKPVKSYDIRYNVISKRWTVVKKTKSAKYLTTSDNTKITVYDRFTFKNKKIAAKDFDKSKHLLKLNKYYTLKDNKLYYTKSKKESVNIKLLMCKLNLKCEHNKGKTVVMIDGMYKQIDSVEYQNNKGKYKSASADKVMCKHIDNPDEVLYIPKLDFEKNNELVGINYDTVHCLERGTNKKVSISKNEYRNNKDKYYVNIGNTPRYKVVNIYDNDGNRLYITDESFAAFCKKHTLPYKQLYRSLSSGEKIYMSTGSQLYLKHNPDMRKFKGWYAKYA